MWLVANESVAEAAVCEIEHPFHTFSRHSGAWAWHIVSDTCLYVYGILLRIFKERKKERNTCEICKTR